MDRISAAEKSWSRSSLAQVMVPLGISAVATTPYPMDSLMNRNSVEGCNMPWPGDTNPVARTLKGGLVLRRVILAFVLLCLPGAPAAAQQYVWSVPSLDVMDKGKVLLELYTYLGPTHPRSVYLGPRIVAGLGGHVEVGVNVSNNVRPTSDSRVELALKWKPWTSAAGAWQLQVGAHGYLPVYYATYTLGACSY